MRELRQLDQVAAERVGVRQRHDTAARLQALPAPERTLLGRTRDPHAAERARLAAAVGAADQQLVALDQHAARLERDVAQPPAWARAMFGERPRIQAEQYDPGVREVARYRIEHEVSDDAPELGIGRLPGKTGPDRAAKKSSQ